MLIVVEGPDKAGKTTFVRQLVDALSESGTVEVLHCGPIKRHPLDEYVRPVALALGRADHVVCDRLHIGEAIYGPLLRGESRLLPHVEDWIDMWIQSKGGVIVWMDTDVKTIKARIAAKGDDLVDTDMADAVFNGYRTHMAWRSSRKSTAPTYSPHDPPHIVPACFGWPPVVGHPSYVGNHWPDILLVGDERSSLAHRRGLQAAFAPYPWSCGDYLMKALAPLQTEKKVGLVNANEYDSWEQIADLYGLLGVSKVIALGAAADMRLDEAHIPHGYVPHPQWVKRFHFSKVTQYGEAIAAAADGTSVPSSYFKR